MIKKYYLYLFNSIFITIYLSSCTTQEYSVQDFEICGAIAGIRYYNHSTDRIKVCNKKSKKEYICTNSLDFEYYNLVYDSLAHNEDKKSVLYNPIDSFQEFTALKIQRLNTITKQSGEMEVINYILKEVNQKGFVNLNDTSNAVVKLLKHPELLKYDKYTDIIFSNTPSQWQKVANYYQLEALKNAYTTNNVLSINHCKTVQKILTDIKQNKNTNKVFYCLYLDNSKAKYIQKYYMDVFVELTQYKNEDGILQFKKKLINPESFFAGYVNLE
jgi:hypothetical protein